MPTRTHVFADSVVGVFQSFDHLFTSGNEAVAVLSRRQKDALLEHETRLFLRGTPKSLLARLEKPTALLFRQVATPTHEVLLFLETAKRLSLQPLILEYLGDKFVGAGNRYKRTLGKLPLYQYTGSDGRDMVQYKTIIDFNKYVGKPLSKARCKSGVKLVDFHHDLFEKMTDVKINETSIDGTTCFHVWGNTAVDYYDEFLSLAIRDCIIFENFELVSHLRPFLHNVVVPAFERVETGFDHRPLIVRLLPKDSEERLYWDAYPKGVERFLD